MDHQSTLSERNYRQPSGITDWEKKNTNRRNQRPWATSGWKQDVRIQYKEDDLQNDSKRDKISDSGETWNQFW